MNMENVKDAIAAALRDHLAPTSMVSVNVEAGEDSDGDPVLRVRFVYDPAGPAPEVDKMFTATSAVRDRLAPMGEERFPIISYVSRDDLRDAAA